MSSPKSWHYLVSLEGKCVFCPITSISMVEGLKNKSKLGTSGLLTPRLNLAISMLNAQTYGLPRSTCAKPASRRKETCTAMGSSPRRSSCGEKPSTRSAVGTRRVRVWPFGGLPWDPAGILGWLRPRGFCDHISVPHLRKQCRIYPPHSMG